MQKQIPKLIHPQHISKVSWTPDMEQKLSSLIDESRLSLRVIARSAGVTHVALSRLIGNQKTRASEVGYQSILRVLKVINKSESDLFSCWECGFSD